MTNRPIGSTATKGGKPVVWSGADYGWQTRATHEKLKREGAFKHGAQEIRRATNAVNGFVRRFVPAPVRQAVASYAQGVAASSLPSKQEVFNKAWGTNFKDRTGDDIKAISDKTNVDPRIIQGAVMAAQAAVEGKAGLDGLRVLPQANKVAGIKGGINAAANRNNFYGGIPLGAPNADDAARAARAAKRAPNIPEPARAQPRHGNSSNIATRENIPPNAPLPPASAQQTADQLRGQRSNLPLRQVSLEQRTAAGRGDPLSRGRTEAAVQGQYNLEETQAAGRRQRAAERPLKEGGGRNPNNIYPHAQGADARPVLNRGTIGPDGQPVQRRAQRPASKPTAVAPDLADSDGIAQRRAEGDRSAWSQQLQGEFVGPAPGSVPRSRRPNVTVGDVDARHRDPSPPVGRDLWASDRNPLAGRPIGGRRATRAEQRNVDRFFSGDGTAEAFPSRRGGDVSDPRYLEERSRGLIDNGDYEGDRFTDTGGFATTQGDAVNPGYSVRNSRATGQGAGRRGQNNPFRGANNIFGDERIKADMEKAGIDLNQVRYYDHLSEADQVAIKAKVQAMIKKHVKSGRYQVQNGRVVPFKSGDTTLSRQVTQNLDERRFPEQFNQIEARDRGATYSNVEGRRGQILEGGTELPTRSNSKKKGQAGTKLSSHEQPREEIIGVATKAATTKAGQSIQIAADVNATPVARRQDNVVGGRQLPQSDPIREQRAQQRARIMPSRAAAAGTIVTDGSTHFRDVNQLERMHTRGRQRVVQGRDQLGTDVTNPNYIGSHSYNSGNRTPRSELPRHGNGNRFGGDRANQARNGDAAFARQVEKLSEQRTVNTSRAAVFNALPVTMDDAVRQMEIHHGKAKAQKILNKKVRSIVDADGNDVSIRVRDLLEEQIAEQAQRQGRPHGRAQIPFGQQPGDDVVGGQHLGSDERYYHGLRGITRGPRGGVRVNRQQRLEGPEKLRAAVRAEKQQGQIRRGTTIEYRVSEEELARRGQSSQIDRASRLEARHQYLPQGQNPALPEGKVDGTTSATIRPRRASRKTRDEMLNGTDKRKQEAYKEATKVQTNKGSTIDYSGPSFRTRAEAEIAGRDVGSVTVDNGTLYNDFRPDGEIRSLSLSNKDKTGNPARRMDRAAERARTKRANNERRQQRMHDAFNDPVGYAERLKRQQEEMEAIRRRRARNRAGR
jgi:hypothetical protein